MEERKEAIIEKIMKLMELGNEEKNTNPHEREAAMKKAAKMMAEYSINFADLKASKKEDTFITFDVEGSSEQKIDYEARLANAIANAFDCKLVNKQELNKETYTFQWYLCFLGSKHDIDIVVYFFKFLRRTLGTMSIKNVTKESIKENSQMAPRRITEAYIRQARNNYCFGMVLTIKDRLDELYLKREEFIPSDCKDLVLVKKNDLNKFMHETFPNLQYSRSTSLKGDMAAYQQGKSDGHKVNLSRPIDSNHSTPSSQLGM